MERVIADDAVRAGSAAGSVHWLKHALLHPALPADGGLGWPAWPELEESWHSRRSACITTGRRGVRPDMLRSGCGRRCLLSRSACDNPVVRCPVVVGRDGELAALAEVFGQAASGPGVCVVVTGEAGVGKTRLVTEAAGQARERGAGRAGRAFDASGPGLAAAAAWRGAAGWAARPAPSG
ncbi:MAG TPA: ATP-binding protein [Streptosporangiaceae bacterium]|nr:ATP-binding protein [Streptosporangiaceae bacterium]